MNIEDLQSYSRPRELNENNVIYWSPEYKACVGSVRDKAIRFLRDKLIEELDIHTHLVHPIPNYNHTTYTVVDNSCNCQGFKKNGRCSHTLAVSMFKFIKIYNRELQL